MYVWYAGLDLRRMRNHRGLKPFQLARANGHSSIARQLCDTRSTRNRQDRRRRTAEGGSGGGGGGGGGAEPSATTPEALLTMLIQVLISRLSVLFQCLEFQSSRRHMRWTHLVGT